MNVYIFTECGQKIGFGHIMRCVALYDECVKQGYDTVFVVNTDVDISQSMNGRTYIVNGWYNMEFIKNLSYADIIIIDSYIADEKLYHYIADNFYQKIYIDDTNRIEYIGGFVLNPSMVSLEYNRDNVLSGSEYVILRKEFVPTNKIVSENIENVLITIGGTDVLGITEQLVGDVIEIYGNVNITVISKQHIDEVTIVSNATAQEMCALIKQADIVVTGAGQTVHELIALQTPFIPIVVADNQKNNAKALLNKNVVESVIYYTDDIDTKVKECLVKMQDYELRKRLAYNMHGVVDGRGCERVISKLKKITIKKATIDDMEYVYNLSNKQYVRKYSINKGNIQWSDHIKWYNEIIKNEKVSLYIAYYGDEKSAQVRFNINDDTAVVSISVDENIRGLRLANKILKNAIIQFNIDTEIKNFIAYISDDNVASRKIFETVGFLENIGYSEIEGFLEYNLSI